MPQNNNRPERIYTKEFKQALETVFTVEAAFAQAFQPLQTLDGVRNNATAFSVKTNNTPVVIGTYNKGANVAMGTGTSSSNRFGDRTEIIYTDTDVPYDYDFVIHEGLDNMTVNEQLDYAVAERQILQAQAVLRKANVRNGLFLSTKAGSNSKIITLDETAIINGFSEMKKTYKNLEVNVPITAYISSDIHTILVKAGLTNSSKGSAINVDNGTLSKFMNFTLVETPDKYFATKDVAYFTPNKICIPFVGFDLYRAISPDNFAGVALQALGKGGTYVAEDNTKAIYKFKVA